MEGEDDDGCADSCLGGPGGDGAHEGEDAGEDAVAGEVVLSEPDVLDSEPVCELDLLEAFLMVSSPETSSCHLMVSNIPNLIGGSPCDRYVLNSGATMTLWINPEC